MHELAKSPLGNGRKPIALNLKITLTICLEYCCQAHNIYLFQNELILTQMDMINQLLRGSLGQEMIEGGIGQMLDQNGDGQVDMKDLGGLMGGFFDKK